MAELPLTATEVQEPPVGLYLNVYDAPGTGSHEIDAVVSAKAFTFTFAGVVALQTTGVLDSPVIIKE